MSVVPTEQIGNLIRHWVFYDNKIAELNKQVKSARESRNAYEAQTLQMISAMSLKNPVIQIGGGGRLLVSEDKHTAPLTFTTIEALLHDYYAKKPGARDETADIIKFIKANREVTVSPCLKRQGVPRTRDAERHKDS
jgi:hypothetical protein